MLGLCSGTIPSWRFQVHFKIKPHQPTLLICFKTLSDLRYAELFGLSCEDYKIPREKCNFFRYFYNLLIINMLRNKQPIWLHDLRTHKAEFAKSETEKQIWKKITLPRKNKAAKFLINPQTMDGLLELPDCRPSILCLLDAKMESRLVLVTHRHPTCQHTAQLGDNAAKQ